MCFFQARFFKHVPRFPKATAESQRSDAPCVVWAAWSSWLDGPLGPNRCDTWRTWCIWVFSQNLRHVCHSIEFSWVFLIFDIHAEFRRLKYHALWEPTSTPLMGVVGEGPAENYLMIRAVTGFWRWKWWKIRFWPMWVGMASCNVHPTSKHLMDA